MATKDVIDRLPDFEKRIKQLSKYSVYAGIPRDNAARKTSNAPNNAVIGYLNDQGSERMHIPQREFLRPGIERGKTKISRALVLGIKKALKGENGAAHKAMNQAGLIAQREIRRMIVDGIPPPLAKATLRARMYRNKKKSSIYKSAKGELVRREAGGIPGMDIAKPLIETGEFKNTINYVVVEN